MGRQIITERDIRLARATAAAAVVPEPPNGYLTKLLKYIPAEVISLYVALAAMIKTAAQSGDAYWIPFWVGVIGTPLYLWKVEHVEKTTQLLISTLAFVVWVFALGGPFEGWDWYQHNKLYAALALPIYTFFVGIIDP